VGRLVILVIALSLFMVPGLALGGGEVDLYINGEEYYEGKPLSTFEGEVIERLEVGPRIVDGRTMAPLRIIMEESGAGVISFLRDNIVLVSNSDKDFKEGKTREEEYEVEEEIGEMHPGGDEIMILYIPEGKRYYEGELLDLEVEPIIVEDRMLYSVREMSEILDGDIEWDPENRRVDVEFEQ